MPSESARATTAAEARFRIDAPNSQPRCVMVVALDRPSETVVKRLAKLPWSRAGFFTASSFASTRPQSGAGFSMQGWLSDLAGRTKENLVSTDNGIIMARHRLMRAAKALVEKGTVPPGVDLDHQRVRSAAVIMPPDRPFKDAAKEQLKVREGVAPASV